MFKFANSNSNGKFFFKGNKCFFFPDSSVFLLLQSSYYFILSSLKGFTGVMSGGLGLAETAVLKYDTVLETWKSTGLHSKQFISSS